MGLRAALRQAIGFMAAVLMLALVAARPVAAQGVEPTQVFGEALKSWTATQRVRRAFVIVRREGRVARD